MEWDEDAKKSLGRVPFFVRKFVKKRVEDYVRSRGKSRVSLEDLQEARTQLMGGESATSRARSPNAPPPAAPAPELEESVGSLELEPGKMPSEGQIRRLEALAESLASHETRFYNLKICGGVVGCPLSLVEPDLLEDMSGRLRTVLEESHLDEHILGQVKGPILSHHKFKVAVAACPNSCSEPQIKDFGVIIQARPFRTDEECSQCGACVEACKEGSVILGDYGPTIDYEKCVRCGQCARACPTGGLETEKVTYKILVGGKMGRHPQFGQVLVEDASEEEVYRALTACLELLKTEGRDGERLGTVLNRVGLEFLRTC